MERLAAREQAQELDAPARDALRQTLHYFATGIPRHAADEEEFALPPAPRRVLPERPVARRCSVPHFAWSRSTLRRMSLTGSWTRWGRNSCWPAGSRAPRTGLTFPS